jgi:hypothetical protein
MKRGLELEKICVENDFVLLDTCALTNYFNRKILDRAPTPREMYDEAAWDHAGFCFWNINIRKFENIYVTERILKEVSNFYYKGRISKRDCEKNKYYQGARKTRALNMSLNRQIVHYLEEDSRIFKIRDSRIDEFNNLIFQYPRLLEKIRQNDFDLVALGMILAKENKKVSIVTFDLVFVNAFGKFVKDSKVRKNLSFYTPYCDFSFKKEQLIGKTRNI